MIAFLVVAHDQPAHLKRLTERLRSDVSAIFVHVDAKSDLAKFAWLDQAGVELASERVRVNWSGWSHVRATIGLLRQALADPRPFTRFALLSGIDYPLARPETMLSFLDAVDQEAIDCARMPNERTGKPLSRFGHRWLEGGDKVAGWKGRVIRRTNRLLAKLPPRNVDRAIAPLEPHGGTTWWTLSREAAQRAVATFDAGGRAVRAMRHTFCPDELFYPTVIASTIPRERIGCAVTFVDWSRRATGPAPAFLDDEHFERLTGPNPPGGRTWLFARKADPSRPDLLDRFDAFADARTLDPVADRLLDYEAFNRQYSDDSDPAACDHVAG